MSQNVNGYIYLYQPSYLFNIELFNIELALKGTHIYIV